MWFLTAQNPITCRGCNHTIPAGQMYLSDIPELKQEFGEGHSQLGVFRTFHTNCGECPSDISCYQRYASQQPTVDILKEVECSFCDHTIHEGQKAYSECLIILMSKDTDESSEDEQTVGKGFFSVGNRTVNRPVSFAELSPDLIRKLRRAGLGNGRGIRTHAGAEQLYVESIPAPVRNSGEEAIRQFLKNKQASHVESVANAPGKAQNPGNIKWESGKSNQMRGSRNMNGMEKVGINAKNGTHAVGIVAKNAAKSAGRGAILAVVLEAPVSAIENGIHVAKGRKSKKEAIKDTVKDTGKAGAVGGIVAGGIAALSAVGAGAIIAPAAPVLAVAGTGMFAISAIRRIGKAIKEDADSEVAMQSMQLYFHAECNDCDPISSCYDAYVEVVSTVNFPAVLESEYPCYEAYVAADIGALHESERICLT